MSDHPSDADERRPLAGDEAPAAPVTEAATSAGGAEAPGVADDPAPPDAPDPSDAPVAPGAAAPLDAAAPDATATGDEAHATFVVVEVVNVSFDLPSPSPILHLLEEAAPYRSLYFPVGLPEAQSIALALADEAPPRPGTHDLLTSVLAAAGCDVVAVRITGERGGTILAELDLMGPRGHEVVDCRPTDGIAVALRLAVPAPILCEASLLDR